MFYKFVKTSERFGIGLNAAHLVLLFPPFWIVQSQVVDYIGFRPPVNPIWVLLPLVFSINILGLSDVMKGKLGCVFQVLAVLTNVLVLLLYILLVVPLLSDGTMAQFCILLPAVPILNIIGLCPVLKGIWAYISVVLAFVVNTVAMLFWTFLILWPLGHTEVEIKVCYGIIVFTEIVFPIRLIQMVRDYFVHRRRQVKKEITGV